MKILEFTCPSCGATLKADPSRGTMFCEYCGKKLILDDEAVHVKMSIDNAQEAGFEFEQGRMNARSDSARSEAEKIESMISALPECETLKSRYDALMIQYREQSAEHVKILPLLGWSLFCLILLRSIYINFLDLVRTHDTSRISVIFVMAAFIIIIVSTQYHSYTKIKNNVDETEKQMDAVRARLNALMQKSGLDTIPERYRTMDCLSYLHSVLMSRTAFTISQAIHNYELYERQLELAEQNRQQLELQRQQLEEMQALKKKMDEKDDDDDGSALGTIVAIGLGVLVGRSIFKK